MSRFKFILPTRKSEQVKRMQPIVSLFNITPKDLKDNGKLREQLKKDRVTNIEMQVLHNPLDTRIKDVNEAIYHWNTNVLPDIRYIMDNGFRITGLGDCILREKRYRDWVDNDPDATKLIQHVFYTIRGMGGCDGIEMVDESEQNLQGYNLQHFTNIAKEILPLAYPGHFPQQYEKYGSYQSRYFPWYVAGHLAHKCTLIKRALTDIKPYKEISMLISCLQAWETKMPDGTFRNTLTAIHPDEIAAQVMYAAGHNVHRFRFWSPHPPIWDRDREKAKEGNKVMVGMKMGSMLWEGFSKAMKTLRFYSQWWFTQRFEPEEDGPLFYFRFGGIGGTINRAQVPVPDPRGGADLKPYEVKTWNV